MLHPPEEKCMQLRGRLSLKFNLRNLKMYEMYGHHVVCTDQVCTAMQNVARDCHGLLPCDRVSLLSFLMLQYPAGVLQL